MFRETVIEDVQMKCMQFSGYIHFDILDVLVCSLRAVVTLYRVEKSWLGRGQVNKVDG
jgi:hypothetical protein